MHPNEYPREEAVCALFASRIEPAYGFVAYGVLWFFVAGGLAAPAALIADILLELVLGTPRPAWSGVLIWLAMFGPFLFAWRLFFRWASQRRRRARQFFMEGVFIDSTVVGSSWLNLPKSRPLVRSQCRFTVDGAPCLATFYEERSFFRPIGSTCPILFTPTYHLVVLFQENGTILCSSWNRESSIHGASSRA